jgi:hypothetical protein
MNQSLVFLKTLPEQLCVLTIALRVDHGLGAAAGTAKKTNLRGLARQAGKVK